MTGGGIDSDSFVEMKEQNGNNVTQTIIFGLIIDRDCHQNIVLFRKSVV